MGLNPNNVAIVHDWLPLLGGAEKVLESIHRVFPGPIHTLIKNEEKLKGSYFEDKEIITSIIQGLPFGINHYRNYLPLFPYAIEQLDLRGFDLVISSSYAVAKGILTNPNQLHICYCHSPMRYAWDLYHQYLEEANLKTGIKGILAKWVLHYLRNWDVSSTNRVDYFIANSHYIAKRIKKLYNRRATVIYPPVGIDNFELYEAKEDYYLTASRMVPYKKMDLIVEAFSLMPGKKLLVIGDGPDFNKIKMKAGPNVTLLGYSSSEVLKHHMQRAKAFIFAAEEDFGIIPVEAQACGTPVIAYGKGGALETVLDAQTGVFFYNQTVEEIVQAVNRLEAIYPELNFREIRKHAEKFNKARFETDLLNFVTAKLAEQAAL
jgi:glycosyltransferase involved in cell wall biosynthesis